MRIALCQLNVTVGDPHAHAQQIADGVNAAAAQGAELAVTGECAIGGYPAGDLWQMPSFLHACAAALQRLATLVTIPTLVGAALPVEQSASHDADDDWLPRAQNIAALIIPGRGVVEVIAKQCLPNYDVFDEARFFIPGSSTQLLSVPREDGTDIPIAVSICEDLWRDDGPWGDPALANASLHINLSASPYRRGRMGQRAGLVQERAQQLAMPLVLCGIVGGHEELVFDGCSLVCDSDGRVLGSAPAFAVSTTIVDVPTCVEEVARSVGRKECPRNWPGTWQEETWGAITLGIRDYVRKSGSSQVLVGLSGGIDSALVLALAIDALGPSAVRAVTMPSHYSSSATLSDAHEMANRLGIQINEVPISDVLAATEHSLDEITTDRPGLVQENLQARIRGLLLMAESNRDGSLVLATSNKSESAVGYATLYGDMCGAIAPIADLYKTDVWAMAKWWNSQSLSPVIPPTIIARAPSAELRHDQLDTDSLPDYDVLDQILYRLVEGDQDVAQIAAAGFDKPVVQQVASLLVRSQYKRAQAAPVIRVSARAFGKDWRRPIVCSKTTWS